MDAEDSREYPDLKIFDVSKGMQFVKETEEGEHRHEGHEADDGHHHHHAVVSIRIYGVPSKGQGSLPGIH